MSETREEMSSEAAEELSGDPIREALAVLMSEYGKRRPRLTDDTDTSRDKESVESAVALKALVPHLEKLYEEFMRHQVWLSFTSDAFDHLGAFTASDEEKEPGLLS